MSLYKVVPMEFRFPAGVSKVVSIEGQVSKTGQKRILVEGEFPSLLLASRSGSYAREQGVGHRSVTIEDLAEMIESGGREGKDAVRAAIAPLYARLDSAGSGIDVTAAAADFVREAADVPNAFLLGKGDSEIDREIMEAKESLRVLEQARASRRVVSAPFAAAVKSGWRQ